MNQPVRLLLIGAGKMGVAHADVIRHVPDAQLVAIASRSGTSAEKLAKAHGNIRFGDDWKQLAAETSADACIVAVSHLQNPVVTRDAIDMGLHVLSEKPVAFSSSAVLELAELAESKGLVNLAAVNRRFYPGIQRARATAELYGPLLGITCFAGDPVLNYRASGKYDRFVYDNWMLFQTIHLIDVLRLLGGEVISVSGSRIKKYEDNVTAQLTFENGIRCNYSAYSSARTKWGITLHCDGFDIELSPLEKAQINFSNGRSRQLYPTRADRREKQKPGLAEQLRLFIESICGTTVPAFPSSTFRDHSNTLQLIEQLLGLSETPAA
ncbi:MAG: Gfo/Idh/MocA family oxidoreductase [Planctomycetaceae bacterium]|nr:Gfo/Idh/MocA family oxidoreductase [Planctomycetaceae bacterium]